MSVQHISRDYLLPWLPFGGYMMFHVHFGRISRPLKSWPQCIGQKYTVNICTAFVIHTWIHPHSSDLILNPQNTISIVLQYYTGCRRRIWKFFEFKIWKKQMLVLKQTIPQKKALILSFNFTPWKWLKTNLFFDILCTVKVLKST